MDVQTCSILGAVCTLAALLLWYFWVRPKVRRGEMTNKFLVFLDDFFSFRKLYIEAVLRFLYTLATFSCVFVGFWMMFGEVKGYYYSASTFQDGLIMMIGGPIILRLVYELIMMGIMLVQNVLEINKKLPKAEAPAPQAPNASPEPRYRFCTGCGTRYDASISNVCPKCGKKAD